MCTRFVTCESSVKLYKYLYGAHSVVDSKDVDLSTNTKQ